MKIYIAGHNQEIAISIREEILLLRDHKVTARWLDKEFNRTDEHSERERVMIAQEDYDDITSADALLLIASHKRVPGGKFVEAGIALGQGKPVHVIGHRENMLMWHPDVHQFDSLDDWLNAH
ncbi:MAG: nucleoside 2-deoxyribosyltransferase [Candidatus Sedimenticola sp. 6PFRAG7]